MDNDMLSSLLSDPEALQNAMKTVSGMLGGAEQSAPSAANDYDPTAEWMERALPVFGAIVQSGQGAVKQEKRAQGGPRNPLVTHGDCGELGPALRLVRMAPVARAALNQFGQLGRTDGAAPPDDGTRAL